MDLEVSFRKIALHVSYCSPSLPFQAKAAGRTRYLARYTSSLLFDRNRNKIDALQHTCFFYALSVGKDMSANTYRFARSIALVAYKDLIYISSILTHR